VSSGKCLIFLLLGPCDVFVVPDVLLEAAVQDTDEAVAELAQCGAVAGSAGAELVVVGAGASCRRNARWRGLVAFRSAGSRRTGWSS
jgi:hypothetical protein